MCPNRVRYLLVDCCFSELALSKIISWIMCPSRVRYLLVNCCFNELALSKIISYIKELVGEKPNSSLN